MSQLYLPTSLEKSLKALLLSTMAGLPPNMVGTIASVVDSAANNEKYAWIGQPPQMEELADEVKFTPLSDTGYTITNKTFVGGISVPRTLLEDDQVGGVMMRIKQLAEVAKFHPDKILMDAVINGADSTLGLCYDAGAFFSATHSSRGVGSGSGSQSNLLTGAGTSTANIQTDLQAAIAAMLNFKAENGEPFHLGGVRELLLLAPPALIKPIQEVLYAQLISNTSNVQVPSGVNIKVRYEPRLTSDSTADWYLLNIGGSMKPLIFQDRISLQFEALEQGDSESAFNREEYRYKVRARYNVGYAFWQSAIKINN